MRIWQNHFATIGRRRAMDKGFERCCDLIARMIEKYGDKVLQDFWKEKEVSLEYGK